MIVPELVLAARIISALIGVAIIIYTVQSVLRVFVVPRGEFDRVGRLVFQNMRRIFDFSLRHTSDYNRIDRRMAYYAPIALLTLPVVWLLGCLIGYAALFWSLGAGSAVDAIDMSGSSLLTLGTTPAQSLPEALLSYSEAALGLIVVALLISYLPTMYQAFSRREVAVTLLETRAGSPPSALALLERIQRQQAFADLNDLWSQWEAWFAEVEETHTSLGPLCFFRSPVGRRSWVTAAGVVLDAASLTLSSLDLPTNRAAPFCIRSGYLALHAIADFLDIHHPNDPKPTDPISISREEFDAAIDRLKEAGLPIKTDREASWQSFAGWRVNYDHALLELARITVAPPTAWVSDRSAVSRGQLGKWRPGGAWERETST